MLPMYPRLRKHQALDAIGRLEEDVAWDPLDYGAWLELISLVETKNKAEQVHDVFERFLARFPTALPQWIRYINNLLARGDNAHAEELFARSLTLCQLVALWLVYTAYIRRTHDVFTGGEQSRKVVFDAFSVAADNVGLDIDSGELWQQYIEFIDNWRPSTQWEQQQKIDLLRKVYHRCVKLPIRNVERLWNSYLLFEQQLDATNARRFISEHSPEYMAARLFVRELENQTEGLDRGAEPARATFLPLQRRQVQLWHLWLAWERANHMKSSPEVVATRVEHVFKQVTHTMRFFPEFWFEYALWKADGLASDGSELLLDELVAVLRQGLDSNPTSYLLNFTLAEWHEEQGLKELVDAAYTEFIHHLTTQYVRIKFPDGPGKVDAPGSGETTDPTATTATTVEMAPAPSNDIADDAAAASAIGTPMPLPDEDTRDKTATPPAATPASTPAPAGGAAGNATKDPETVAYLRLLEQAICHVYGRQMYAAKRMGGLSAARAVFKLARQNQHVVVNYQLYVGCAELEMTLVTDTSAPEERRKVTNRASKYYLIAVKRFGSEGGFWLAYLRWWLLRDNPAEARVVLRQALDQMEVRVVIDTDTANARAKAAHEAAVAAGLSEEDEAAAVAAAEQGVLQDGPVFSAGSKKHITSMFIEFIRYEQIHGDIGAMRNLEKQFHDLFKNELRLKLQQLVYRLPELDPVYEFDLGGDEPGAAGRSHSRLSSDAGGIRKRASESEGSDSRRLLKRVKFHNAPHANDFRDHYGGLAIAEPPVQHQPPAQDNGLPEEMSQLLRALPGASHFPRVVFDPAKVAQMLAELPLE